MTPLCTKYHNNPWRTWQATRGPCKEQRVRRGRTGDRMLAGALPRPRFLVHAHMCYKAPRTIPGVHGPGRQGRHPKKTTSREHGRMADLPAQDSSIPAASTDSWNLCLLGRPVGRSGVKVVPHNKPWHPEVDEGRARGQNTSPPTSRYSFLVLSLPHPPLFLHHCKPQYTQGCLSYTLTICLPLLVAACSTILSPVSPLQSPTVLLLTQRPYTLPESQHYGSWGIFTFQGRFDQGKLQISQLLTSITYSCFLRLTTGPRGRRYHTESCCFRHPSWTAICKGARQLDCLARSFIQHPTFRFSRNKPSEYG